MYFGFFCLALAVATVWKLYQVCRAPRSLPLRWLTLCLACAAVPYLLTSEGGRSGVDGALGVGAAKLVADILFLGMSYCLMVFYLYSADDGPSTRRRVRLEGLGLLGFVGGITVAAATAPRDSALRSSFQGADMTIPQVAAFYLGLGVYLMYAYIVSCRRTRRYARMSSGHEAVGLWLATAGLLGHIGSTAVRSGFAVVRTQGVAVPDWLTLTSSVVLVVSTPVFVLGVTWPGAHSRLTAWRVRRRHRRVHRQLEPLWLLLSTAYPDTVLPDTARGRRAHRAYTRRVVECRDGLVRISPQLRHAAPAEPALESLAPEDLALRLRRAAKDVRDGHAGPQHGTPLCLPLCMPHAGDREADVQQLVTLSRALRALPG
ncbi:MAB_1171c family putative transporter [Streptomyces sp. NPDC127108]|uniref:MAB_1171c family putative transporter n=1 Tax=Streptomyces sp. NPDC127108 TaxID=3345361 RepID=UPI00363264FA